VDQVAVLVVPADPPDVGHRRRHHLALVHRPLLARRRAGKPRSSPSSCLPSPGRSMTFITSPRIPMETTTRLILPEVIDTLGTAPKALAELTWDLHLAAIADLASALEPELAKKHLVVLPVEVGARLLENLDEERRGELSAALATADLQRAAAITDEMAADARADLYATIGEELRA